MMITVQATGPARVPELLIVSEGRGTVRRTHWPPGPGGRRKAWCHTWHGDQLSSGTAARQRERRRASVTAIGV